MKPRIWILFLLAGMLLSGCGPGKPVFEISGSPNPLTYGCGASVMTFKVTGPGEGLKIESIILAYQLFDGSGKKVREATLNLYPIPYAPSVSYDASRIIVIPDSTGSSPAPDEPILDFGEGRIDFAATIYAKFLSPSSTGPEETFYFTDTKSIPVLPCTVGSPTLTPTAAPTPTPLPTAIPTKKDKCVPAPNHPCP